MGLIHRAFPAKVKTAMTPKGNVTMGGPQVPSLQKRSSMSAATPVQGMGDKHVASGRKSLRAVPSTSSKPGFAGKATGAPAKRKAGATSPSFAGKAKGKPAKF